MTFLRAAITQKLQMATHGFLGISPCAKSEKSKFACTPRPTSKFLHWRVHYGIKSRNLLVGTKTTPPKLIKEADFRSDFRPSIARPTREASEMPINGLAKASHLNAVRQPLPHGSRKRSTRIADKNRQKARFMCFGLVVSCSLNALRCIL